VFLTDGTSLISYGEPARVSDRVIFSMQAVMRRAALGALMAMMLPLTAHAQTGKHIAIGASVAAHDYTSDRIRQGVGIMLLYRVAPNGNEENGLSWGPSATIGFSRADVSSDVAGGANER
jgi:hypothetical protein